MNFVRFSVFADFHYKKSMYIPSVADLEAVFERARQSGAEFVLSAGDFCNDYQHSPEIIAAYLQNHCHLPVYGVYGNHELETPDNSMEIVTPCLTNRKVVWGTPNGRIGDGSIAYYYFEKGNFRFVCLDTNYSIDPVSGEYVHNPTASHQPPKGNRFGNSVGSDQLRWLEAVLTDAAQQGRACVILSHFGFSSLWWSPQAAEEVRSVFAKANGIRRGTILLAINGHLHTNRSGRLDEVVYFDVNTVRNTLWVDNDKAFDHYADKRYVFTDYDANGKEISRYNRLINEMRMAKNTWFNSSPLSAIVTVWENGSVEIEGEESSWLYGIAPPLEIYGAGVEPRISSVSFPPLESLDKRMGG